MYKSELLREVFLNQKLIYCRKLGRAVTIRINRVDKSNGYFEVLDENLSRIEYRNRIFHYNIRELTPLEELAIAGE